MARSRVATRLPSNGSIVDASEVTRPVRTRSFLSG